MDFLKNGKKPEKKKRVVHVSRYTVDRKKFIVIGKNAFIESTRKGITTLTPCAPEDVRLLILHLEKQVAAINKKNKIYKKNKK